MLFKETVTFPLEMNPLQEVLKYKQENVSKDGNNNFFKEPFLKVSYKDSTLKGKFFINYVANLKLSINLEEEKLDKEEKFELLKEYMLSSNNSFIEDLNNICCGILLERKGIEVISTDFMSKDEREEFYNNNKDIFGRWESFFENIPYNLPFLVNSYSEGLGKKFIENGEVDHIIDANYVGKNIAYLCFIPDFVELYISLEKRHKPVFYESQWYEPIFEGNSFMNILTSSNNTMIPFMTALFEDWYSMDEIKKVLNPNVVDDLSP